MVQSAAWTLHKNTSRPAVFSRMRDCDLCRFAAARWTLYTATCYIRHVWSMRTGSRDYAPVLKELRAIENRNATYRFVATMTYSEKSHHV